MAYDKMTWEFLEHVYKNGTVDTLNLEDDKRACMSILLDEKLICSDGRASRENSQGERYTACTITVCGKSVWEEHARSIKAEATDESFRQLQQVEIREATEYYKKDIQTNKEANDLSRKALRHSKISNIVAGAAGVFGLAGFVVALITLIRS